MSCGHKCQIQSNTVPICASAGRPFFSQVRSCTRWMQKTLMLTETLEPFVLSSPAESTPTLQERMQQDGYLFLPQLINTEAIEQVRGEILELCAEAGWLKFGSERDEGIAADGIAWVEPQPEFMAVYNRIQHSEAFHALAHDSALMAVLERLFGESPLPHARNIARIIFPQNTRFTTPSHQDYLHIQGTEETYTAWVPLGDCPKELGSLAVLRGSHHLGILPVHYADGAGGMGIDTEGLPCQWVGGDFAEGDAILFHSLAVHKALPNTSRDQIRLSVDYRYQPLSHPVHSSSMEPHYNRLTWKEIYAGWTETPLKYYWRELPLNLADLDPRVQQIRAEAK